MDAATDKEIQRHFRAYPGQVRGRSGRYAGLRCLSGKGGEAAGDDHEAFIGLFGKAE